MNQQPIDVNVYVIEQLLGAIERRNQRLNELAVTVERISGRVEQLEAERNTQATAPNVPIVETKPAEWTAGRAEGSKKSNKAKDKQT